MHLATTIPSTALAFPSTNGVLLLEANPLVDLRAGPVTKSEFERRAAEMKARNLVQPRFRNLPPPRSIFAPPRAAPAPAKVYVRDFLREVDIKRLSSPLAAIKKLDQLETDRDGLLDLTPADLQISVSPDLLLRGIKAYDAVLAAAAERGWPLKLREGVALRVMVSSEPLELAVTEKTEPLSEIKVRPGERRPRRPTGALVVSMTAGYVEAVASRMAEEGQQVPESDVAKWVSGRHPAPFRRETAGTNTDWGCCPVTGRCPLAQTVQAGCTNTGDRGRREILRIDNEIQKLRSRLLRGCERHPC
jgi:hypothetical protein